MSRADGAGHAAGAADVAAAVLAGLPEITPPRLRALLRRWPAPADALDAVARDAVAACFDPPVPARVLDGWRACARDARLRATTGATMRARGTRVVLASDAGYPIDRDEIPDHPAVLLTEGERLDAFDAPAGGDRRNPGGDPARPRRRAHARGGPRRGRGHRGERARDRHRRRRARGRPRRGRPDRRGGRDRPRHRVPAAAPRAVRPGAGGRPRGRRVGVRDPARAPPVPGPQPDHRRTRRHHRGRRGDGEGRRAHHRRARDALRPRRLRRARIPPEPGCRPAATSSSATAPTRCSAATTCSCASAAPRVPAGPGPRPPAPPPTPTEARVARCVRRGARHPRPARPAERLPVGAVAVALCALARDHRARSEAGRWWPV